MAQGPPFNNTDRRAIAVVVNPMAAGGRTGKYFADLEPDIREAHPDVAIFETNGPHEATTLTRQALRDGAERVVSVGGDGTHFEVLNGFFDGATPLNPNAAMAIIPLGTGSDLAKTLDIPHGRAALWVMTSDSVISSDLGRATVINDAGEERICHFISTAHVGIGADVSRRVNGSPKWLGGFVTFLSSTLISLAAYRNQPMSVTLGDETFDGVFKDVIVANGLYDGGGMQPAPNARLDSGVFEIYTIGDISALGALGNLPLIYRGKLHEHPKVNYRQSAHAQINSPETVYIALDGEVAGHTPATLELVPGALNIVTGESPAVQ